MQATIIISPEQALIKFKELVHIMHNLRFYEKYWHQNFGHEARARMECWQQKADKLLDELGLTAHNNINSVQIIPQR